MLHFYFYLHLDLYFPHYPYPDPQPPAHPQTNSPDAEKRSPHSRPLAPGPKGCKKDFGYECPAAPLDASTNRRRGMERYLQHWQGSCDH